MQRHSEALHIKNYLTHYKFLPPPPQWVDARRQPEPGLVVIRAGYLVWPGDCELGGVQLDI